METSAYQHPWGWNGSASGKSTPHSRLSGFSIGHWRHITTARQSSGPLVPRFPACERAARTLTAECQPTFQVPIAPGTSLCQASFIDATCATRLCCSAIRQLHQSWLATGTLPIPGLLGRTVESAYAELPLIRSWSLEADWRTVNRNAPGALNHPATSGLRSNHGCAFSSCAARRNSVASSP